MATVDTSSKANIIQTYANSTIPHSATKYPQVSVQQNGDGAPYAFGNIDGVQDWSGVIMSGALTGTSVVRFHWIDTNNYSLSSSIPASATIRGVVVEIERHGSNNTATRYIVDHTVQLIKGGTAQGDNKADTVTQWLTTEYTKITYGSPTDLWGLTLTRADVVASDFGVRFTAQGREQNFVDTTSADVQFIRVTVYFTDTTTRTDSKASILVSNSTNNSSKAWLGTINVTSQNNSAKANIAKTVGNINSTDTDLTVTASSDVYGYRITPSETGVVQAIYFHVKAPSSGNTLYVALYNTGTSTTVGTIINSWSKATVGTVDQWVVIPVSGISLTASTNYWLVAVSDVGATFHGRTVGGTRSAEWTDVTPGSWTSPPTGVSYTNNEDLNAFMTYTALSTVTSNNSAKASIVRTESKGTSAKANIVNAGQQPDSVKANIFVTDTTKNNSVKANIISTYYTGATYDWNYSSRALTESSVTVNGTASGRDEENSPGGEKPIRAFDGDLGTKWLQFESGGVPFWLQYDFGADVKWRIVQYSLTTANDVSDRDPKTWQLLASNTGDFTGEEVIFDTVEDGALSEDRGSTKTFICDNPVKAAYRYYRLNISDIKQIIPANSCQLAELALYGEAEYENRGYQG